MKELNGLVSLSEAFRTETIQKRPEKGVELYYILLTHMAWEQDIGLKTLWKHYSEEEIMKRAQEALKSMIQWKRCSCACPYMVQAGALG